ncbi:PepSY-like domain-containing protein [Flavilitoribacter nigricans]|uniref:Putative beta-lactamase-inhibitor-like PepSY-like domain-containing protein n=1 Tax=Flavilitoribacter nigricans (strain ATCC 23147 / DSM 23189 / NBRC 102662 / NCIMB 1420 / SS-2) TaxID=1122177 RepID=A0A2D0MWM9_FLAN2|nr:PepSY-like domain-containing protein [Flavilitoribacter nigricans]PHN00681.1 hypothetical protein CRP01_41000 [Flavilitoribacter nigricans DSM 23189 = NBRC 102662]
MRRLLFILALLFSFSFGFTACDSGEAGDDDIEVADLPQSITSYVTQNYPGATIEEAEREEEDDKIYYEIELSSGEELRFDSAGSFIGMGD